MKMRLLVIIITIGLLKYCQNINHLSKYVLVNCDVKGFKWFNEIYGEEIA